MIYTLLNVLLLVLELMVVMIYGKRLVPCLAGQLVLTVLDDAVLILLLFG
jgi:hypothetical protein